MEKDRLKELYEQYGFVIYRRCLNLLGSKEEARDAMQDVFMKLLECYDTIHDKEAVIAWIYKTTQNLCFNRLRFRKRFSDNAVLETFDNGTDSERTAEDKNLIRSLFRFLKKPVREAAWLTHVEGLSQEEIRKVTGQSPATVRRNLDKYRSAALKFLNKEGIA